MDQQHAEFQARLDRLRSKRLRHQIAKTPTQMSPWERAGEFWQASLASYRENWMDIWTWILGVSAFLLLLPISSYGSYLVLIALYVIHVQRRSQIGQRDVTRLKR